MARALLRGKRYASVNPLPLKERCSCGSSGPPDRTHRTTTTLHVNNPPSPCARRSMCDESRCFGKHPGSQLNVKQQSSDRHRAYANTWTTVQNVTDKETAKYASHILTLRAEVDVRE
ncbi:protein of unknown function [Streptomyces murinus]